jgi:transcriptional regulator with XRE-family HTH domain
MNNLPELGRALAELRRQRGVTQADLAMQAGLRQPVLSRFEAGRVGEFGSRKLLRLLELLGAELSFTAMAAPKAFTLDDALAERVSESRPPATTTPKRVRRPRVQT